MDSIDEDENEQFLSPERVEFKNKLLDSNSASRLSNNIKLNSATGNSGELDCDGDSLDSREMFPVKHDKAKEDASSESVSLDSEEEDLKFLREQEEEMALSSASDAQGKPSKPMLSDDPPSNPIFGGEEQDYDKIQVTARISQNLNGSSQ